MKEKLSLTNSAKRAIIKVITNTVIINKNKNKGVRKMKITNNYNMSAKELFNAKNGSVDIKSVLGVQLNAYAAAVAEETNSDGITENIFYIATDSGVIGGKAVAIVEAISDLCDFMADNEISKENPCTICFKSSTSKAGRTFYTVEII